MPFAFSNLFLLREMAGPMTPVIGRQFALEQPAGRSRVSRAVAAVDVSFQLGARGVTAHADLIPAIVEGGRSGIGAYGKMTWHFTFHSVLSTAGRGCAEPGRLPRRPFFQSGTPGASGPRSDS